MASWSALRISSVALVALLVAVSLSGCKAPFISRAAPDHPMELTILSSAVFPQQYRTKSATEVIGKRSLALQDCRTIALARNLDLQVKRFEELSNDDIRNSFQTRMLPHLVVTADVSRRNNLPFAYADVLGAEGAAPGPAAGTGVTNYHTYRARNTWRGTLEAWWSPTDAAMAYLLQDMSGNSRLRTHFQRVRMAQRLIAAVDSAYYRLIGLQESLQFAEQLLSLRETVTKRARALLQKNLIEQEEYRRARRKADQTRRLVSKLRNDLEKQRNILAVAMGISPDHCDGGFFADQKLQEPMFKGEPCELEMLAVKNRPEAFIAGLNHVSSVTELRKNTLKYLPKVSAYWRYTRDSDRFLSNKDWYDVGFLASFDALEWLAAAREVSAAKFNVARTQSKVGVIALGIMSEVRVAALDYIDSLDDLGGARRSLAEAKDMLKAARGKRSKQEFDRVQVLEAEADFLQHRITDVMALARANAALGELISALGTNYTEPMPCN